jgi:hypothetical protein
MMILSYDRVVVWFGACGKPDEECSRIRQGLKKLGSCLFRKAAVVSIEMMRANTAA